MNIKENKKEIIAYIDKASIVILGLLFIVFPVLFVNITTDFFGLPKEILVIFAISILFLIFGVKTLLVESVRVRRTPFDLAVIAFLFALLLSSIFSVSRIDSFINFVPILFAGLGFFAIVQNVKNEKSLLVLFYCLLAGASITSLVAIFSFFKIYVLPFDYTKVVSFTTLGSTLDQALYFLFTLPVGLYFLVPHFIKLKNRQSNEGINAHISKIVGFSVASVIILAGLIVSIFSIATLHNTVLLPMETGFQTAFASISQDTGRVFQGFLFGSGFGEFFIDFTKFKLASFNTNPTLWNLPFIHSSSFVLELLATTGILGLLSFLFLCFKIVKEKPLFIPLIVLLAVSFLVPFSFYSLGLLFILLGLYASLRGLTDERRYFDVEIQLVAFKKGFFAFSSEESRTAKGYNKLLSYIVFGIILIFVLVFGFLTYDYLSANVNFQKSLIAANQNNGQLTYNLQSTALSSVSGRYVDSYYRIFSQTNLALANSLASSIPAGAKVSAQTTQTVYTLVQQSINAARQATTVSPQNAINWENLASIYRALIGFGQNADSFALLAQQQATQLNSTNPQEYIALGGIYYQLSSWDKAQENFQQAINLKADYANAYYNLGHVLLQKGDLKGALTQFQTVASLIPNDPVNLSKINGEIKALETQIGQQQSTQTTQPNTQNQSQGTPLTTPAAQTLPPQQPPVKIPAPQITPTPSTSPTPSQTPSPTP